MQQGDVSNNGTDDIDYVQSIARQTAAPPTTNVGFFTGGSQNPTNYADFDASYQPINGLGTQGAFSRYTVQDGDTLQSIAQAIWGDANFWYLIADANGLSDSAQLISGMDLVIPNKIANVSNSSSTFRVYDPNLALGDTSPTHPPKPQNHNSCGMLGSILVAVVAVAVTALVPGIGAAVGGALEGLGIGADAAAVVGAAATAAVGDIAGQGVALATGLQSKFNWGEVGMAALSAGVTGGLNEIGAFSGLAGDIGEFGVQTLRGATASLITQGIGVATGLQSKFDWAGGAAAGISQGVGSWAAGQLGGEIDLGSPNLNVAATRFVRGMAGGIAGAAARSLITGSDFGDNIMAVLPNVIGQTAGNAIADAENQMTVNVDPSQLETNLPTVTYEDGSYSSASVFFAPGTMTGLMGSSIESEIADLMNHGGLVTTDGTPIIDPAQQVPEEVDVIHQKWDWFQKLMYDIGGDGGVNFATGFEDFFSSAANNAVTTQLASANAYASGGAVVGRKIDQALRWMAKSTGAQAQVVSKTGDLVWDPRSPNQPLLHSITNGDVVFAGLGLVSAAVPAAALFRGAAIAVDLPAVSADADVVDQYVANLPRFETPTSTPYGQFEVEQTGRYNYRVPAGKTTIDIDGYRGPTMLDAKYVGDPAESPYVSGSDVPEFIRQKIWQEQDYEFQRYKMVIDDPKIPFTNLEIITNEGQTAPYFYGLLQRYQIPGSIRVVPTTVGK